MPELSAHPDGHAFPCELFDHVEHAELPSVVNAILDEAPRGSSHARRQWLIIDHKENLIDAVNYVIFKLRKRRFTSMEPSMPAKYDSKRTKTDVLIKEGTFNPNHEKYAIQSFGAASSSIRTTQCRSNTRCYVASPSTRCR